MGKSINNPQYDPRKRLQKYYFFFNQQLFLSKKTFKESQFITYQHAANKLN